MFWRGMPVFDWLQVEVTSHCNASCLYCPRTVYRDRWLNRHLSLDIFEKLLPVFKRTRLVFLQGWGEPFLSPDFFAMAALAKKAGCAVGTTTNGMLLDEEKAARLVDTGVDVVAFSLAGTSARNDFWRRGTRMAAVLGSIRRLAAAKARRRAAAPAIHVAYMLLRSGLDELSQLPDVLTGTGVQQVVISTLDFVPAAGLEAEALSLEDRAEYAEVKALLDEVVDAGKQGGLEVHYQLPDWTNRRASCTENTTRAAFIAADGSVSPCVFTNLPVDGALLYVSRGREMPYRRLTFGNISTTPLAAIWHGRAYAEFRAAFATGQLGEPCANCPKLYNCTV
ncbi:MAG: radical SAM protein [Desulfotomaculales bacterium]